MHEEIIVSGFGGQGALFAGQLLTYTGMDEGWHVTWIPSYGPEMRGGTAHCIVILSDDDIGSPIIRRPTMAIVMNPASMDKYEPLVKPGGSLIINASMVDRPATRTDITTVAIPCNDIAEEIGNPRLANMVAIGALLACQKVLSLADLETALNNHMPGRHKNLLPKNVEALSRGTEFAQKCLKK
jgi:2-oxoglutarate ferredoxin oxidoreductase subunit gamma